jgi:hypothetical protein
VASVLNLVENHGKKHRFKEDKKVA